MDTLVDGNRSAGDRDRRTAEAILEHRAVGERHVRRHRHRLHEGGVEVAVDDDDGDVLVRRGAREDVVVVVDPQRLAIAAPQRRPALCARRRASW